MAAVGRAKTIAVSHLGRVGTGRHHSDTVIAAHHIRDFMQGAVLS